MPFRINMTAGQFRTVDKRATNAQTPDIVQEQSLLIDNSSDFIVTENDDFIALEDE